MLINHQQNRFSLSFKCSCSLAARIIVSSPSFVEGTGLLVIFYPFFIILDFFLEFQIANDKKKLLKHCIVTIVVRASARSSLKLQKIFCVQSDRVKDTCLFGTKPQNLFQVQECYTFHRHWKLWYHLTSGSQSQRQMVLNQ